LQINPSYYVVQSTAGANGPAAPLPFTATGGPHEETALDDLL